jgi:hypothetical protein
MATYYVRPDGVDSNSGLGSSPALAWRTITRVFATTGYANILTSGDTVYIAPGSYREASAVVVNGTYTSNINIIGDTTGSQFTGVQPGRVLLTNRVSDTSATVNFTGSAITVSSNYITFNNFLFENASSSGYAYTVSSTSSNVTLNKCMFNASYSSNGSIPFFFPTDTTVRNYTINQCVFYGKGSTNSMILVGATGSTRWDANIYFNSCYFHGTINATTSSGGPSGGPNNIVFKNCWLGGGLSAGSNKQAFQLYNCFLGQYSSFGDAGGSRMWNCITSLVQGVFTAYNTYTNSLEPFDFGMYRLWGISNRTLLSAYDGSFAAIGGTTDGSSFDFYGNSWPNNLPQIGLFQNESSTIVGPYNPIEKSQFNVTFTPNETSKSFNVYVGAIGLTHTTPGLSAFYTRQNGIGTTITLVNQTPTGSWVSGGFCAIDTVNQPGLYRLDVPNAAFVSGASNVTIGVRSTSGVNGAYINCQALDIPSALLNTQAGIYTSAGTLGARLLQTVADNRPVIVTANRQIQIDSDQAFAAGTGATILDPIVNSVGRWTLKGDTMTLFAADGTYLRRVRLAQLGLSLNPS